MNGVVYKNDVEFVKALFRDTLIHEKLVKN